MANINNINNAYGISNRRAVGKISFNVGDRFNGRIVKKIEPASAIIRLGDGVDFEVDVEGDLESLKEGLSKFEVSGFKDGKLQLKVVNNSVAGEGALDNFQSQFQNKFLSNIDEDIVNGMLKFNIPLTKENVKEIRSLLQFLSKINQDPKEIDNFIEKYISTKNIENSTGETSNNLKSFLNEFKNLSKDDILFFIENNLEFDEQSIKAFNKIIKTEGNELINNLKKLSLNLEKLDIDINIDDSVDKNTLNGTFSKNQNVSISDNNINQLFAKQIYSKQENENKIDVLSLLKSISGQVEKNENQEKATNSINGILNELGKNNIKEEASINILKNIIDGNNSIEEVTKSDIEEAIYKETNKELKLSEGDFEKIKVILNDKDLIKNVKLEIEKDAIIKDKFILKDEVKEEINKKGEEAKEILKDIINSTKVRTQSNDKIMSLIKESISDIKLMNKINNEYYYFDSNIRLRDNEYPCKLIIKDNRKDGKTIDSSNVKMIVSIKTINLGEVDAYINVIERAMSINFKCEEKFISIIESINEGLHHIISTTGYIPKITVEKKDEPVNIVNCRGFFNQNNRTNLDIKV